MDVDLKSLLRKLNRPSTNSLQSAVGQCVTRGHYEVTVEHLLQALIEDNGSDVPAILRHFGVQSASLLREIQRTLDRQRSGNTGRPVFSPLLIQWVRDAWLLGSIEFSDAVVRSGVLLLALVRQPDRYTAEDLSSLLEPIRRDELQRELTSIAGSTPEAQAMAAAAPAGGGGGAAGAPGGAAPGGGDSAIARFMIDFTAKAKAGEIDPVFGRDREIRQM